MEVMVPRQHGKVNKDRMMVARDETDKDGTHRGYCKVDKKERRHRQCCEANKDESTGETRFSGAVPRRRVR